MLDASAAGKSAAVLGSFEGKDGAAIVAVEKKPFDPEQLPGVRSRPRKCLRTCVCVPTCVRTCTRLCLYVRVSLAEGSWHAAPQATPMHGCAWVCVDRGCDHMRICVGMPICIWCVRAAVCATLCAHGACATPKEVLGHKATLSVEFQNAEYGVYSMLVPPEANVVKVVFLALPPTLAPARAHTTALAPSLPRSLALSFPCSLRHPCTSTRPLGVPPARPPSLPSAMGNHELESSNINGCSIGINPESELCAIIF